MEKKPLVVITGPTAVGKTEISIKIAKSLNGEIISADSMQIYKYMNIGTAKPTAEECQGIPHHMMDFLDPACEFSVAQYQKLATDIIKDIHKRHRLPIVVGGTGLYIKSLIYPMNFTEAQQDLKYRKKLYKKAETLGKVYLHEKLRKVDPASASRLHPNDTRRIVRALEVYHLTGKPMSEQSQNLDAMGYRYDLAMIGLTMNRAKLYERINQRVDNMIKNGLLSEVKELLDRGYTRNMISMQGLGYKEIIDYFEDKLSLEDAIYLLKRDTRRYAKRQLTWLRREKEIKKVSIDEFESLDTLIQWVILFIRKKLSFKLQKYSI